MATAELKSSLEAFTAFAHSLKGDEKSEAQSFLDHFFRALCHGGVQEAGATLEFRIAKKPGSAQLELIKGESALNQQLAAREQTGEPITPPGFPLAEHLVFITDDGVRVAQPASSPSRNASVETAPLDTTRSGRPSPNRNKSNLRP